jgi:hypothetical protein
MSNEILGIVTDILPIPLVENDPSVTALLDEILKVLTAERRVSAKKCVGDDTHRPHIYGLSMTFLQHNLGSGITKGSSHCREHFVFRIQHFCNSKIGKDKVGSMLAGEVQKILRFEIWNILDTGNNFWS